jgi:hypothetical protein
VNVAELYLNGNTGFAMAEFYRLLEDSQFVAKVIEIYCSDRTTLERHREPGDSSATIVKIQEDSQWKSLVKKHLADWLFRVTDILTMQAKFASRGYPMSRAQLAALFDDAFLIDASEDLLLKDGRNEVWSAYALKRAINTVLPEIKTSGAVTLANLARRINAKSKEIIVGGMRARLSGKHLQKLLKKHDIDWTGIKESYKKGLLAQTMHRTPTRWLRQPSLGIVET